MKPDKALSMLGLAARAGRIVSGEFTVEKEVKSGRAYLVLIAEDASENTRKNFRICVNSMKYQCACVMTERGLDILSAKTSAHPLQYWMRDSQITF